MDIDKLLDSFAIVGKNYREYAKKWIANSPDTDPGEICQDVANLERLSLRKRS